MSEPFSSSEIKSAISPNMYQGVTHSNDLRVMDGMPLAEPDGIFSEKIQSENYETVSPSDKITFV